MILPALALNAVEEPSLVVGLVTEVGKSALGVLTVDDELFETRERQMISSASARQECQRSSTHVPAPMRRYTCTSRV